MMHELLELVSEVVELVLYLAIVGGVTLFCVLFFSLSFWETISAIYSWIGA